MIERNGGISTSPQLIPVVSFLKADSIIIGQDKRFVLCRFYCLTKTNSSKRCCNGDG